MNHKLVIFYYFRAHSACSRKCNYSQTVSSRTVYDQSTSPVTLPYLISIHILNSPMFMSLVGSGTLWGPFDSRGYLVLPLVVDAWRCTPVLCILIMRPKPASTHDYTMRCQHLGLVPIAQLWKLKYVCLHFKLTNDAAWTISFPHDAFRVPGAGFNCTVSGIVDKLLRHARWVRLHSVPFEWRLMQIRDSTVRNCNCETISPINHCTRPKGVH